MSLKFTLYFIITFLSCSTIHAQIINKDSLSLANKISDDRFKLTKLESMIDKTEKESSDAAVKAQKSADANKTAAVKLSENPLDKKLARQAENDGDEARSDAKKARKASDKLIELNKNIADLKNSIAGHQNKLSQYTTLNPSLPLALKTDSTK